MAAKIDHADNDLLRELSDRFRQRYSSGVVVLAAVRDGKPSLVAAVTEDLVSRGLRAGDLVNHVAAPLDGKGGGRPTLALAGGKDASKLDQALASVLGWVSDKLHST